MAQPRFRENCVRSLLYRALNPSLCYWQLLCSAPYPMRSLQQSGNECQAKSYFKQARFLFTSFLLAYVIVCCLIAILQLIEVPMPFFTGALYVNEVVLGVLVSVLTVVRSYNEEKRYNRFVQSILTVASGLHPYEWQDVLSNTLLRMRWICAGMASVFVISLVCDYLHFKSLSSTIFSLGAYVMPNMLVTLSLLQCCFGILLIHRLSKCINQRLVAEDLTRCDLMQSILQTEQQYLQLTACMELITRSYEVLIVVNTFAGINVTSLQLLEIYQHLQVDESNELYITYNFIWVATQLCMLLMILYPCHLVKQEQSRLGLIMFELSQHDDVRVEPQIARFSLLTLNRKDTVYTAYGILKLELSSLSSIFVALLSFMIILIQFDKANLNKPQGGVTAMESIYNSL